MKIRLAILFIPPKKSPKTPQKKTQKPIEIRYHSMADEKPPSGAESTEFNHQQQREAIILVHADRADKIEPASQRPKVTHGQGMGLQPHPLTSVVPQGTALNLSTDASNNPEAQANAELHPELTPVPTAQLQHQAVAQASPSFTPQMSKP